MASCAAWPARSAGSARSLAGQAPAHDGADEVAGYERVTCDVAGGRLCHWVHRASSPQLPWVVLLPGLTADHTLFAGLLEPLARRWNVIAWDAPAHGASRPFELRFSMDDCARLLHQILRDEGAGRPTIVGQSLGGYVAQAYMQRYPGQTAGFVSIDSAPLQRRYLRGWEIWALRHMRSVYLGIPWRLLRRWGERGTARTEAGRANMRAMMARYDRREYCELAAHGYRMLADAVERDLPYAIDCPALLLCGERDEAGSTRRLNSAWHAATGIPLVWVPAAGHNSCADAPAFVSETIERFVQDVAARDGMSVEKVAGRE